MVETAYSVDALEGVGEFMKLISLGVVGSSAVAGEGKNLTLLGKTNE